LTNKSNLIDIDETDSLTILMKMEPAKRRRTSHTRVHTQTEQQATVALFNHSTGWPKKGSHYQIIKNRVRS